MHHIIKLDISIENDTYKDFELIISSESSQALFDRYVSIDKQCNIDIIENDMLYSNTYGISKISGDYYMVSSTMAKFGILHDRQKNMLMQIRIKRINKVI